MFKETQSVPRCVEHHAPERPLAEREDDILAVSEPLGVAWIVVKHSVRVLAVERYVEERVTPFNVLDRRRFVAIELPSVHRLCAQVKCRSQRSKRAFHPWHLGSVYHQVDVVVPRDRTVVTVGAEQCAAVHEVGDIGRVEGVDERPQEMLHNGAVGARHDGREAALPRRDISVARRDLVDGRLCLVTDLARQMLRNSTAAERRFCTDADCVKHVDGEDIGEDEYRKKQQNHAEHPSVEPRHFRGRSLR